LGASRIKLKDNPQNGRTAAPQAGLIVSPKAALCKNKLMVWINDEGKIAKSE
jgi:hypothetical protein